MFHEAHAKREEGIADGQLDNGAFSMQRAIPNPSTVDDTRSFILKTTKGQFGRFFILIVQGDQAACPKPPVDIDVKVEF